MDKETFKELLELNAKELLEIARAMERDAEVIKLMASFYDLKFSRELLIRPELLEAMRRN